jgi:Dehydrogenases (flavoproteins)
MNSYKMTRSLPVSDGYDLLVAGGGPAGYSAAICAARMGARVILIEMTGTLGGMATSGLVCNMDTTSDGKRMIVGGLMGELLHKMYDKGYISHYYSFERFVSRRGMYTPFEPEGMKLLLDDMAEEANVEVHFFTRVVDVEMDETEGRISGVIVSDVEGLRCIRAKYFVDATGDAALTAMAGFPCICAGTPEAPGIMPPTLCALHANIPWDTIPLRDKSPVAHSEMLPKAVDDGFFSQPDKMVPGLARHCADMGGMNAGHIFNMDALDAAALSDGMKKGRRLVQEYTAYYQKYVPGFENLQLAATAALMGVRESRRIVGLYTLTFDDYKARRKFDDQIALYSKSIDVHPYTVSEEELQRFRKEVREQQYSDGESYGIPYRILIPQGSKNLWTAGRCVSAERPVNGSIRVQPPSAMMGQAAGTAAVLCARTGADAAQVDINALKDTLRSAGAILE